MKSLRPGFQRSARMIFAAILSAVLVVVAGLFLVPAANAGQVPGPPAWVPIEMEAICLYRAGLNQEISNPQAALKTLEQARQDSFAAITSGGGANWAVQHNDQLIGQALMIAEMNKAPATESQPQQAAANQNGSQNRSQSRRSGANKFARLGAIYDSRVALTIR